MSEHGQGKSHGGRNTPILLTDAMNKLAKWRSVYAGWRLGTRAKEDGESQYTRDLHEMILLLRAEVSALNFLIIEAGVSRERWEEVMLQEFTMLDKLQEQKFPGMSTSQAGVHMKMPEAAETMKRLGFPQ